MSPRGARSAWIVTCIAALGACASPAARFEQAARSLGLEVAAVQGAGFDHALLVKPEAGDRTGPDLIHVYLDGDGTPTVAGVPAGDPTPRNPLVLRLMALDPGRAVYLGRPCYHGRGAAAGCAAALWTDARYGEPVVASLAAALERYDGARGKRIAWFGYSGGGVLALLLARRFPQTVAVVTVAANLDVAAWARHHRRLPLAGSLNPAARPPLPPNVVQRHYFGSADQVVPGALRPRQFAPEASWIEVAGFDHVCCWQALWPDVLAEVAAAIEELPADRSALRTGQSLKLNPTVTK